MESRWRVSGIDVSLVLDGESPLLIDEWSEVPEIWDAVVQDKETGIYIVPITALKISLHKS